MQTVNDLGMCEKCKAPLCVSGREVVCQRCGLPVPNHPATVGWNDPPPPPPAPVTGPLGYAATLPDRVLSLERRMAAMERAAEQQNQQRRK